MHTIPPYGGCRQEQRGRPPKEESAGLNPATRPTATPLHHDRTEDRSNAEGDEPPPYKILPPPTCGKGANKKGLHRYKQNPKISYQNHQILAIVKDGAII